MNTETIKSEIKKSYGEIAKGNIQDVYKRQGLHSAY